MPPVFNPNSFEQEPARGAVDLQITKSGVISGVVSANQATALKAGDAVKLDTATGFTPNFVKAGVNDTAIGILIFDVQKSSPVAGDAVQVAFFGGPVTWQVAGDTVDAQEAVESDSSGNMVPVSAGSQRGIALDPAVSGQLFRVITNPVAA